MTLAFTVHPGEFGKVAVLMGGLSAEREVSLRSGAAVLVALQRQNVDAHGVDVGHDIVSVLLNGQFDRAFIALHGRRGEDGVIQGMLETLNIPYTGSGVLGSALSMDKVRSKQVWQAAELPTPAFVVLDNNCDWSAVVDELGLPLAVKPVHEGSSLGATCVRRPEDLEPAWRNAAEFDARVMAEPWVTGEEYTIGILGGEVLPVIRLETPREFYDYEAKYNTDDTRYHCPSGLSATDEQRFQVLASSAFTALGAAGWGRIDFILDKQGEPWLLENNTVPGLTDHSLIPMAAQAAGMSFDELVLRILLATSVSDSPEGVGHGC